MVRDENKFLLHVKKTGYVVYIHLGNREHFEQFRKQIGTVEKVIDIAIAFDEEVREFTLDEFLSRLGFEQEA